MTGWWGSTVFISLLSFDEHESNKIFEFLVRRKKTAIANIRLRGKILMMQVEVQGVIGCLPFVGKTRLV